MASGIPALLSQVNNIENTVSLLTSDVQSVLGMFAGPTWGIGFNGVFQIIPDSIVSVEYKKDWRVPNYPQEQGAFQTYNKVTMPYDARVQMTKGGTVAERQEFLNAIEAAAGSLNLYDIVMPEITYQNANIIHYDYRRTSTNGVGLLTVDIWLLEVRVTATTAFASTAQPSGASPVNDGNVQAQTPTPSQGAPSAQLAANQTVAPNPPPAPTSTAPVSPLPPGYTQSPNTGLVRDANGVVDRDLTAQTGTNVFPPPTPASQDT